MRAHKIDSTRLYKAVVQDVAFCHGLTAEFELRFHPTRKWRFDAAIPELKLGIEIDGAVWTAGRHTRGAGFVRDQEKFREAAILGWKVLRFTTSDVRSGVLERDIKRAIAAERSAREQSC